MNYQTRNGEQVGDLIHYVDYTADVPQDYIGVLLDYSPLLDIFIVICEGQVTEWLAWQCEVVS
tara:strand:+ start:656 stop:844 length:189 start_codon:yes stop_codon:yes gene_type:complete